MKRKLSILAIVFAAVFSACKKVETTLPVITNVLPVVFKPDSSVMDQTIQVAKTNQLIFAGVFNTGNINGFQVNNIRLRLKKGGDAANPNNYLRNIRAIIEDTNPYNSEIKDSVSTTEFSFNNFLRGFPQYQTRALKVYADILAVATNGIGADDNLTVSAQLTYTGAVGNTISTEQTPFVDGQKFTFTAAPLPFSVVSFADSTNPAGGIFIENQSTDVFRYAVGLNGLSGSITSHRLLVQGQASSAVTALKLYSGSTPVGQGTVSGGVCTITTNDPAPAGTRKFYSVVPVLAVTPNSSNYNFNIILDDVKAVSTANEQKNDATDRAGNNFIALKTALKIERMGVTSHMITDSTEEDTYQLKITNIGSSAASFTQISYGLLWANNSPGMIDTLQLKPRLLCNGLQPSGLWTNQNGDTSTTGGFFKETTPIITYTFTTEYVVQGGALVIVMLKTFRKGFKTVNDGFRIRPIFDATKVDSTYKSINQGTIGLSRKLYITSPQTVSANPYKRLFIWSDMCDPSHSGTPGVSSKDFLDSYGFPDLIDEVHVR